MERLSEPVAIIKNFRGRGIGDDSSQKAHKPNDFCRYSSSLRPEAQIAHFD